MILFTMMNIYWKNNEISIFFFQKDFALRLVNVKCVLSLKLFTLLAIDHLKFYIT